MTFCDIATEFLHHEVMTEGSKYQSDVIYGVTPDFK